MAIDINELRRLLNSTDMIDGIDLHANIKTLLPELLDRLEAAESEALEQARLNGMGAEREAALLAKLEATEEDRSNFLVEMGKLCAQCDALLAKIEAMEKQEPVGYGVLYVEPATGEEDWDSIWKCREFAEDHIKDFTQAYADIGEPVGEITTVPLYALPGAKGE